MTEHPADITNDSPIIPFHKKKGGERKQQQSDTYQKSEDSCSMSGRI